MKRGYRLLLALTLSLALVLGMTATASAATATTVKIGGVALTAEKPYYQGGHFLATVTDLNNTAWFDAATNTLTLNNATIDATGTGWHAIQGDGDLTIKLIGENTVTAGAGLVGIVVRGDSERLLTIMGESGASLTVLGGQYGISVEQGASLAISNAAVTATGTTECGIAASNVTITDSTVTATGNTIGILSENAVTIDSSEVTASGIAERGISAHDVTIDHSTVTTEGGQDGIRIMYDMTVTDSTVTARGNNAGINCGATLAISGASTEVTAGGGEHGIYTWDVLTILGGKVSATGNVYSGIWCPDITIGKDTEVTVQGNGGAIDTSDLTILGGNWYQWTGDDGETVHSGIGAMSRPLTVEDAANNEYLKIEPIAFADYDHTLTFMNGEDVWQILGLDDGMMMGIMVGMPVPDAPESSPEGSVFFHWKDENDRRIYPSMTISENMTAYATWALPLKGTVTISGKPVVGKTLTAEADITTAGITTLEYQWAYFDADGRLLPIMDATDATYRPVAADVGKKLVCLVSSSESAPGTLRGETGPVTRGGGGGFPDGVGGSGDEPLITSPDTFDSGIAASMVLSLLTATGTAWLSKKKD